MLKSYAFASAVVLAVVLAQPVSAEIVDVTLAGALDLLQANTNSSTFPTLEKTFIESMSTTAPNNTFSFTFRYDTDATPTTTGGPANNGSSTFTSGVQLLSGHIGTFGNFTGWNVSIIVQTTEPFSFGGRDKMYFDIKDPASSRYVNIFLDWYYVSGIGGKNAFDTHVQLPDDQTINGPIKLLYAGAEVRRSGPSYISYAKSINWGDETILAVEAPEPASLALLALGSVALLRRRA